MLYNSIARRSADSLRTLLFNNIQTIDDITTVPVLRKFVNITELRLFQVKTLSTSSCELLAQSYPNLLKLSITRESIKLIAGTKRFLLNCHSLTELDVSRSRGINNDFLLFVASNCKKLKIFKASWCEPGFSAISISDMLHQGCDELKELECCKIYGARRQPAYTATLVSKPSGVESLTIQHSCFNKAHFAIILRHCNKLTQLNLKNNFQFRNDREFTELLSKTCPNLKSIKC
jgi:hypothetical protein